MLPALAGGSLGALGGNALGRLGAILEPLDYPRQAAANLAIAPWLFPGNSSAAAMLPGALGLLAGGAAAFTPAAPFAPLIGTGVAGAAQGLGKMIAPETFAAPTTGDELEAMGQDRESLVGNLLLGALTDPLTYAGATVGAGAGAGLGRAKGLIAAEGALAGEEATLGRLIEAAAEYKPGTGVNPASATGLHNAEMLEWARSGGLARKAPIRDYLPADPTELARLTEGGGRTYRLGGQADAFSEQLAQMGIGAPEAGGNFRFFGTNRPPFTEVRGGRLFPGQGYPNMTMGELGTFEALPGDFSSPDLLEWFNKQLASQAAGTPPPLADLLPQAEAQAAQALGPSYRAALDSPAEQALGHLFGAEDAMLGQRAELMAQRESAPFWDQLFLRNANSPWLRAFMR